MKIKCSLKDLTKYLSGYLFALTIILQCRSIWCASTYRNYLNYVFLFLLFFSVVIYCFAIGARINRFYGLLISLLSTFIYAIFYLLVSSSSDSRSFICFIIGVWIISILFTLIDYSAIISLLIYYKNLVYIICICSLFFWLFGSCLGILHSTGSIISFWTGQVDVSTSVPSYYGLYFEPQSVKFLNIIRVTRNCAIFTEAPMSSLHFCLAFFVELFEEPKNNKFKSLVLFVGVLSTFAVLGYICVIAGIAVKLIISKPEAPAIQKIRIIIIPFLFCCAIFAIQFILVKKLSYGTSTHTHLDDFRAGYLAWRNHPFFGNGYGNQDSYIKYMTSSVRVKGNNGFSNSPMQILAYGGIYLAIPYVLCVIRSIRNLTKRRAFNTLIFFLFFLILFTVTIIPFQFLTVFLMLLFSKKNINLIRSHD